MIFNSKESRIELPLEKRKNIFELVEKFLNKSRCYIRDLAQCIGSLVAACTAVKYGPLYMEDMERAKFLALGKAQGNFDSPMTLPVQVKTELMGWYKNIYTIQNPIRRFDFKIKIFSDASTSGWGAYCNEKRTHGFWSSDERKEHIITVKKDLKFTTHLQCKVI